MARLPRLVIPHALHHVIQRCHDGISLFRDDDDYRTFLGFLLQASKQYRVAIHAYVLMPDHVHFAVSPSDEQGLSKMMQFIGRFYVPYFNRKYQRSGSLWQGRFKATVLEAETYFLPCSVYMETNPVRSGLVPDAAQYPWSSYQHHAGQRLDPLVSDHPIFWALGNTPFQREANYKEMIASSVSSKEIKVLTEATDKGWLLGSAGFKNEMAKLSERRVEPAKPGRPRKDVQD
ncbi:transposase [Undibacterium sp. RuRC25W]|uniref:transposase n=1 Tax=Undibacterium sp. RuRC25W TaxID=3413047 RepID=UPI003BF2FC2B